MSSPIFSIWIPLYKSDKNSNGVVYEKFHTNQFLDDCTKFFGSKNDLKHIFLLDGTPLFNIDEIPLDQMHVAVSLRPFLREKKLLSFGPSSFISSLYTSQEGFGGF